MRGADVVFSADLSPGGVDARLLADGDGRMRKQELVGRHHNDQRKPHHNVGSPRISTTSMFLKNYSDYIL